MYRQPQPGSANHKSQGSGVAHPLADRSLAGPGWHAPQHAALTNDTEHPIRIAIVGKGGAGKTTVAGALARALAAQGRRVLAIDADPDANLASVLPLDGGQRLESLARQRDLIRTATDAEPPPEGFFQVDPETGQLLPPGTVTWGGGNHLVVLGWGKGGGESCYCAEHRVMSRELLQTSAGSADVTLIDSEAGLEHLSRGTIAGADLILAVVEPGRRSVKTAVGVRQRTSDLGIGHVYSVVCGHCNRSELLRVRCWLGDWPPIAAFPFDERIRSADLSGTPPVLEGDFLVAANALAVQIRQLSGELAP